jgi:hypothetical protein
MLSHYVRGNCAYLLILVNALFVTCKKNENPCIPDYFFANTHQTRTNTNNLPANTQRLTSYLFPHLFLTYNNGSNTLRCSYWPIQLVSVLIS